ncbi:hypothetical protein OKW43_007713 [Paraburkholderia sp. WC7.3g]|uniref:Uncharacterized protein n=1 Tax=Paraburkholderia podalyriae TaxID=1938811 RepID=A0ABR7Q2D6_9BURK|nr:hypothetical protein [Paraburkholderia podalyriae]MBC8752658.1 hypothetical protein [Paraburkholderia podalyriae]
MRALSGKLLTFSRIERWTFKWPIHLDSGRSQNGLLQRALSLPHASRDAVASPGFLALALACDAADRISSSSDSQRLQYRKMYFSEAIRFRNQIAAGVRRANGNALHGVNWRGTRAQSVKAALDAQSASTR